MNTLHGICSESSGYDSEALAGAGAPVQAAAAVQQSAAAATIEVMLQDGPAPDRPTVSITRKPRVRDGAGMFLNAVCLPSACLVYPLGNFLNKTLPHIDGLDEFFHSGKLACEKYRTDYDADSAYKDGVERADMRCQTSTVCERARSASAKAWDRAEGLRCNKNFAAIKTVCENPCKRREN